MSTIRGNIKWQLVVCLETCLQQLKNWHVQKSRVEVFVLIFILKTSKIDQDEMMLFIQEAEKRAPLSDERCTLLKYTSKVTLVTQSSFDGFAALLIRVFTWNMSLCWNIPRDCVKIHLRKSTHFNGGITFYAFQGSITQIDNVHYDGYKTFLLVTLHVYLLYTIRTCVLLHSMPPIGNIIS